MEELNDVREENEMKRSQLNDSIQEKNVLNTSLKKTSENLKFQKNELKRTSSRENYWREKCRKIEENENELKYTEDDIDRLIGEIAELKTQSNADKDMINSLNAHIESLKLENESLSTVQQGIFYNNVTRCYSPEMHLCVYSLLNSHVSTENVSKVIESVLKLVNITPNKLPSPSTINNWNIERGILAKKHLSSEYVSEQENITLHTDEASKYGNKWGAFASRDNEGNYRVLGLRDMATKSSLDTLDTFKEILSDLDLASEGESKGGKKILSNIKNTMSDRAATETKFNELLEEYRKEVLPNVLENYNTLNEESREAIDRINNFFCGLHSIVNMAETCQKTLNEVEIAHFDNKVPIENKHFVKAGQSGTVRLILSSCKCFARRGDEKNGCHGNFKTYVKPFLQENSMQCLPLQPLRGNRFNILFTNAGHVYFLKDQMKSFLEKTPKTNALLSSVLFDLNEPFFLAGCKALGLVSKIITTPLWHIIESKNVTISDMNKRYFTLKTFLEDSRLNLDDFIKEAWLNEQDDIKNLITESRKEVQKERKRFKEREMILEDKRFEKQMEDFRKKEELERKRIEKLEKATSDMTLYGLWQSEDTVNREIDKIKSKKDKEEALKVQLRFRKEVFKQMTDSNAYAFSKVVNGRRVQLTVSELKANLLTLVNKAHDIPSLDKNHLLVGKNIMHKFLVEQNQAAEEKWFKGYVISQVEKLLEVNG
ncbi:uncharacterized protein LOC123527298 [Mercenaria mercenaria]|uniref:uncharacterized protein LOC123527298 n=1 Tax=Mercenaria mercenaria TaxID=6596 RepID=UPI00234F6921|nr:uncharacterized protein LOC123527298 [Mercenaria mercenaria]